VREIRRGRRSFSNYAHTKSKQETLWTHGRLVAFYSVPQILTFHIPIRASYITTIYHVDQPLKAKC